MRWRLMRLPGPHGRRGLENSLKLGYLQALIAQSDSLVAHRIGSM
jgi:hypothetical protein